MYVALTIFLFFVTLSAVAVVLGNSSETYSPPVELISAASIAVVSLILLTLSVFLLQRDRDKNKAERGPDA